MPVTNALVLRYAKGYRTGADSSSVSAYGRREGFMSVSTVEELTSADQTVSQVLASQAVLQRSLVLGIEPQTDADTPYLGVWVRDQVTAPDQDRNPAQYRVVSLTAQIDDEGWGVFIPELQTTSDVASDRTKLWLKRIGDGTLAGRSQKATIVRPLGTQVLEGKVSPISPPPFSQSTLEVSESAKWNPDDPFRLTQVDATLLTPGTSTTSVQIRKNNTTVLTLSFAAGIYHVVSLPTTISFTQGDYLSVRTSVVGTGAAELLVSMIGGPGY
jgi:hypothetical protein